MVAGFHLIWTAYGWWLPNDPRGSSSHEIRVERIADLGELHHGRKPVQPPGQEIREFYEQASNVLKHPLSHPVWGGPGWKVFLDTRADMVRISNYIRQNPSKAGRPAQHWGFVKEYDGWMPGQYRR